MSFDQFGQTDFNRTVTVAMRQNLDTLASLMEKLYRRNPAEWRKSHMSDLATALAKGRQAIDAGRVPPDLIGLRDVEVLSVRSEEHTSELQSLMRISYAVFCLKK